MSVFARMLAFETRLTPKVTHMAEGHQHPHLAHPPIVEAVVDVFVPTVSVNDERLATFGKSVEPDFPRHDVRREQEATIQVPAGQPPVARTRDLGILGQFSYSEDESRVVQARRNGFSFNQLKPYPGWASLEASITALLPKYFSTFEPASVRQLGVRFINRFEVSIDDVSRTVHLPMPPPGVPETVRELLFGATYHATEAQADLRTTVTATVVSDDVVSITFDIHAFSATTLPCDIGRVIERLSDLRSLKNDAFFGFFRDDAVLRFFS